MKAYGWGKEVSSVDAYTGIRHVVLTRAELEVRSGQSILHQKYINTL